MIIPGVVASSISGHLTPPSNFFLISQQVLGSTTNTITFSSIPSTYKSLQLRVIARDSSGGSSFTNMGLRFNSDSGSNYGDHGLGANSGSVGAYGELSDTVIFIGGAIAQGSGPGNVYGAAIVDIVDYASTSKNKTLKFIGGISQNQSAGVGSDRIVLGSGLWSSTAAINSIYLQVNNSTVNSFISGSTFSLYGVS